MCLYNAGVLKNQDIIKLCAKVSFVLVFCMSHVTSSVRMHAGGGRQSEKLFWGSDEGGGCGCNEVEDKRTRRGRHNGTRNAAVKQFRTGFKYCVSVLHFLDVLGVIDWF